MLLAGTLTEGPDSEQGPDFGQLVSRLANSTNTSLRGSAYLDAELRDLIAEILSFASGAERHIAEQRRRIDHLEQLSHIDELTGLANRRGFERFMAAALARASRGGTSGVIGYFDVDHFKRINDSLGHAYGDKVLRHIASLFRRDIRTSDMAARLGGDEFVVALDDCDWSGGAERLFELQRTINAEPQLCEDQRTPVTISIGVAPFGASTDLEQVLAYADEAMYVDKRTRHFKLIQSSAAE